MRLGSAHPIKMGYLTLPISLALIDWIALARRWERVDVFAKPGVMIALLLWTWLIPVTGWNGAEMLWIRLGLSFSLIGDILLLPQIDRFFGGLSAFLLGHLSYITALSHTPLPINGSTGPLLLIIFGAAGTTILFIQRKIAESEKSRYRIPVLMYSLVITLMLATAWTTIFRPSWPTAAAWLVAIGATIFTLSDILLAWNKFIQPLPGARISVRIPYHLGQIAIVLGAALS